MLYFEINNEKHILQNICETDINSIENIVKMEEYNFVMSAIIFLSIIIITCISLDIIQFTPLMQNKFINDAVIFSLHGNYMILMIIKILSFSVIINDYKLH
jgi:hypothetical protein